MLREEFLLDDAAKKALVEEATTVAELHHPSIVEIHAVEQDERGLYLVFERLEGRCLDELIAEHFTSLTFDPGTFATVTSVTDAKFQRDVLVNADPGATSQLTVGYGHDEAADTQSFGPFTVTASEGAPAVRAATR